MHSAFLVWGFVKEHCLRLCVFSSALFNGEITQRKVMLLISSVSVKWHFFVGKSPVTIAISWYLYSKYFHILVWNKTALKDKATKDNSRCIQCIVSMRPELFFFVFTMIPGKDIWRDLANLINVVLPHICRIWETQEELFAGGSIICDKH